MTRNRAKFTPNNTDNSLFQVYRREVKRYPLLTLEEKRALAIRYRKTGDREAAHKLITSNLRLVVKIVLDIQKEFLRNDWEFPKQFLMDLIQEGNLGLILAVENFDPYREVKLSYYASFRIKRFVRNFIREEEAGNLSMDAPLEDDSKKSLHDVLEASWPQADEALEALEDSKHMEVYDQKLDEFRQTLNAKELDILDTRILVDNPCTLMEFADRHSVTHGRVRQIEDRLIQKIRCYLGA